MIITNHQTYSQDDLFKIIRDTYLLGAPSIKPFANAKISIQNVSFDELVPTQAFVFQEQLDKIDDIRTQILATGTDVLNMNGFITYTINNTPTQFVFTPPIVEVIENQPLIIDGQHRTTYAKDKELKFNALFIENIDPSVYPYQLPLRGGWGAVQRFQDRLPDGFVRKERRYLNGTHKYYFREYPFPGIIKLAREHTGR